MKELSKQLLNPLKNQFSEKGRVSINQKILNEKIIYNKHTTKKISYIKYNKITISINTLNGVDLGFN